MTYLKKSKQHNDLRNVQSKYKQIHFNAKGSKLAKNDNKMVHVLPQ